MDRKFWLLAVFCIIFLPAFTHGDDFPWFVAFETGSTSPTETFNNYVDPDRLLGFSLEYKEYKYLGARVTYDYQKLDASPQDPLKIDTLSVHASASYTFPAYVRIFALAGPTYYSVEGQREIGFKSDGKDIGWSGGGGFEFYPVPRWGVRFQTIYHSVELNADEVRMSWLSSTLGLVFQF